MRGGVLDVRVRHTHVALVVVVVEEGAQVVDEVCLLPAGPHAAHVLVHVPHALLALHVMVLHAVEVRAMVLAEVFVEELRQGLAAGAEVDVPVDVVCVGGTQVLVLQAEVRVVFLGQRRAWSLRVPADHACRHPVGEQGLAIGSPARRQETLGLAGLEPSRVPVAGVEGLLGGGRQGTSRL